MFFLGDIPLSYLTESSTMQKLVSHNLVQQEIKSCFCFFSQENYDDPHKTPASPVVHIRGLIDGVVEADLVEALQEFGPIRYSTQRPGLSVQRSQLFGVLCITDSWLEMTWPVWSRVPWLGPGDPLLLGLALVLWVRL